MQTKKIKKAIIPAAGLGTRMLPISYAVPKEMLPIVDLPAIYHLVKEAVDSGIEDILIITNRGKEAMESFFDRSTEYEPALLAKGKTEEIKMLREISDMAIGIASAVIGRDVSADEHRDLIDDFIKTL